MSEKRRQMRSKWNRDVDTNIKIINEKDPEKEAEVFKKIEADEPVEVEIYTTMHLGSTHRIHDFIVEYLKKM